MKVNSYLLISKSKHSLIFNGSDTFFDYYPTSEKKLAVYPNGTETEYEYNCYSNPYDLASLRNHYLKKLTNQKTYDQTVLSYFDYTYDIAGQRTEMEELRGTHTYEYDDLYRLKEVTYPDSRNVEYSYDKAGNRLSMIDTGATPVTSTYTYDLANQMLTSSTP